MKRTFKYLSLIIGLSVAGNAAAYNHDFGKAKSGGDKPGKPASTAKGALCAPANYRKTMDFNDVSCQLETGGLLFLDRANGLATYKVPKTGNVTTIYAGALWMGGTDINNQLKLAAVRFRETGNDFWPGPLSTISGTGNFNPLEVQSDSARRDYGDANIDPDQCLFYDNIFTVSKAGVTSFIIWKNCASGEVCEAPSNEVLNQIYSWPGNGDPGRFQDVYLAPFKDVDEDGLYDPEGAGDYPWYDDILGVDDIECGSDRRVSLFGDQTHWWVFNDKGNIHTESGGDPIGMEVRAQAFAFATDDEINKMTFFNYELINRGTQTLYNTYFSQYMDIDLGNYADDYAGCDVTRGLSYMYNGDLTDEANDGRPGFGTNVPAIGVDFFEGPYQDADGQDNPGPQVVNGELVVPSVTAALAGGGIVYKGLGIGYGDGIIDNERYGMRNFSIYTGTGGAAGQSDPQGSTQFYNYMKGSWQFGDDLVYGGTGYPGGAGSTSIKTHYMFPADSDTLNWATEGVPGGYDKWSEFEPAGTGSTSNPAGDRRFVQSAGPFTLKPGAVNNITVGIVFARSYQGEIFSSVNSLKVADTKAQALFDNCFRILDPPHAPVMDIQELGNEIIIMLSNPKGLSNNEFEDYIEEDKINIPEQGPNNEIYDRNYRFEGYQIFQMKDELATVGDLEDATKARLVAQCDKKNGIDRLINFDYDEELGFSIPDEKVDGEDNGIRHSFRVTEDMFASGDRRLVNNKTYYYIAVAYAYNNFKTYDPSDPAQLDGQKMPYIRSRLNADGSPIASYTAVPHLVAPELGGTVQNSVYGQTPRITRLDGKGNGGNSLRLTQASEDQIVANGFMNNPEYDYNAGPITVKVVDPLNVVGGYFECEFQDYQSGTIDSANWVINHFDAAGNLIDSVTSATTIAQGNEQLVPQWGVSIEINQKLAYFPGAPGPNQNKVVDPIEGSIEYSDTTKPWLSFVSDDASFTPFNWIRSGEYSPAAADTNSALGIFNPDCYDDVVGRDPKLNYAKLLGGGATVPRLVGYECDFMPFAYPDGFTYETPRSQMSIAYTPSIDIVITSDKSKWTRCVVVELGRDENLNQNQGPTGELRNAPSVNKEGQPDGSGTTGMGWFPGYAIDLESGVRLHMAFGENSFFGGDNGADMIWNPTSTLVDQNGMYVLGGQQPIWVFGNNIANQGCPMYNETTNWVYDQYQLGTTAAYRAIYRSLAWIVSPVLTPGRPLMATDTRIKLHVERPYEAYTGTGEHGGQPKYSWNMDALMTTVASQDALVSALDLINVVPNPYYAFADYERNRLDTRVKITNLPDQCTVSIYNVSGKLIRQYKKDNQVTSIDWDLKNSIGVPIASGVYLIHVDVPGVGEKVVKFFGGMRQIDLENI